MASQPDHQLRAVVAPVLESLGYDLEELRVQPAGRRNVVRVVIDRDEKFGLDDVADVSRVLSEALDSDDSVPGSYVLEVSSPGVDRPLVEPRHWRRNAGRLVEVRMVGGQTVTGRIRSADDLSAVIDVDGADQQVPFSDVERARVQIELRPRTDPDVGDAADVDDLEDDAVDAGDVPVGPHHIGRTEG